MSLEIIVPEDIKDLIVDILAQNILIYEYNEARLYIEDAEPEDDQYQSQTPNIDFYL
jgi:hypothetical protein